MPHEANTVVKKFLNKIAKELISRKKFDGISEVDVFFAFGSKTKTAMCDWVYGLKIKTELPVSKRTDLVRELQSDIKSQFQKFAKQSVCCTDVNYN